mmetsp:Transcript_86159/g.230008  ORF Transcript_86159/g.230008 Transcript_86159/m.230008 type:complete len:317 (-) Transcript_86159:1374-2324(-)
MPDTVMAGNDGFPFVLTTAVRQHFTLFWAMVLLWKGYIQLSVRGLDLNENGSVSAGEVQIFVLKNLPSAVDWTSAIVLILSFMMRCLSWGQTEANLLAAASVLLFCNLLLVCIPFQSVGGIIITVYRVLFGDFLRFIFVFGAMIFAFACSLFLLSQRIQVDSEQDTQPPQSLQESALWLMFLALGDNLSGVKDLYPVAETPGLYLTVYLVWVVLSNVLMLNLLIAMMTKTFDDDSEDVRRVWTFPFAQLVLRYEQLLPPSWRVDCRLGVVNRPPMSWWSTGNGLESRAEGRRYLYTVGKVRCGETSCRKRHVCNSG